MWIVKLHINLVLCSVRVLQEFFQISHLSLPASYKWDSTKIYGICMSNDFSANVFHSLVKRRVKTKDRFSRFAVVGEINTEIFISFMKLPCLFLNRLISYIIISYIIIFCFLETFFFWCPYWSTGMKLALNMVLNMLLYTVKQEDICCCIWCKWINQ